MDKTSCLIEIELVDITAYKVGNTGIPYFTCFDSGKPGQNVMLMAISLSDSVN